MTNSHSPSSAGSESEPLWAKLIAFAFWVIAIPFILYAGFIIVGETVEHFTP